MTIEQLNWLTFLTIVLIKGAKPATDGQSSPLNRGFP